MPRHETTEDVPEATFTPAGIVVHMPALIADAVCTSRSDARRLLAEGAVRVNGEQLCADDVDRPAERLDGALVQVGRRRTRRMRMVARSE